MTLTSGIMVFFVMWWIVLFMVLPWGAYPDETLPKGFATGAPKNPYLFKKFLITTGVTIILWCVLHFIMVRRLIPFSGA